MHSGKIGYRLSGEMEHSIFPFSSDEYRKFACL